MFILRHCCIAPPKIKLNPNMGHSETFNSARNFAVMVRIRGPDPKGMKMRNHAFHHYRSGETTLSASGLLVPDNFCDAEVASGLYGGEFEDRVLVVTVASVVEPFLSPQHRENVPQGRPDLISGVRIDIMTEKTNEEFDQGTPSWLEGQLLSLVDVPASALCVQSLVEASRGLSEHEWEVGWSLASHNNESQSSKDNFQTQGRLSEGGSGSASVMSKSLTRMAILSVSLSLKDSLNYKKPSMNKRGDFLLAVGSPFGVLSSTHFFNSLSVGCIANCYPPNSSDESLLMADIRCLPGMEGSPVFSEHTCLTGVLIRPLRQKTSGAEVQLVIPWEAIAKASSGLLRRCPQNTIDGGLYYQDGNSYTPGKRPFIDSEKSEIHVPSSNKQEHSTFGSSSPLPIENAMASVCLITIGGGVWASGVVLNSQGLVLTNAHLLEPWRFGKTHVSDTEYGTNPKNFRSMLEGTTSLGNKVESMQVSQTLPSKMTNLNPFAADKQRYKPNPTYDHHRNIRVRLDHIKPWIWCDAKVVYICKGPWDVALLQLEPVLVNLLPIVTNFSRPSTGSKTYVIGHGLFGPKCGFFPSVSSGVVAKVVEAKTPQSYHSVQPEHMDTRGHFPVMLETTASIHPGASGGAVIDSDGHMIGLVTSNARHGGGSIIPHLNFSIPSAALAPIFKFAKDMLDSSLLRILDEPNEYISSIWALTRPSSPKPNPAPDQRQSLLDNKRKEEKGSQFAKFIAERKDIFNGSIHVGKSGVLSKDVIPSKL